MRQVVLRVAALIAILYAGICVALFIFQRSLIYFPTPAVATANTIAMPVRGARLLVSARELAGSEAVLYFGGNAEDVSLSLSTIGDAFPDRAVYLLHYRGYGASTGKPNEHDLVNDALALFDKVARSHPNITVIGRSLGSGVAVQLASRRPVARLVLVTPYDSIARLAASQFPYLPVRWLLQDRYESSKYAPRISAPTLLIAAEHDEIIPISSTETLFRSFRKGVARLEIVPMAGHNTISESRQYLPLMNGKEEKKRDS